MKHLKLMKEEFEQLEVAITSLKQIEKELDDLKLFENNFGSQIDSIRANLKRPEKVEEVKRALSILRQQIEEHKQRDAKKDAQEAKDTVELVRPPTPSFPPELEGLYYDASCIGSGGFARVFKAKRKSDDQKVAVKVPIALDTKTGDIFFTEIASWQRLSHVNIVKLYDQSIFPILYLEMELCQRSLDDLHKPLELEQAASLVLQIAEGLKHAHIKKIFHRDIKPQNVLLQAGVPKIGDWGLSKLSEESISSHGIYFSPRYAAPEQISQEKFGKPDHRTDIYQLGAVFYNLVTGKHPLKGDNITELMAQIIMAEPERPSLLNPQTNAVEQIIMKCLKKEMKERYQSVAEIQQDLAEYLKEGYKDSLEQSEGNMKRSGHYLGELCLVHLTVGDLANALKYARDLSHYASAGTKAELADLASEIEYRLKENIGTSEELVQKASIVLHPVKMGW